MAADYYNTLGVSRDASEKDIRTAYRRLARQYHPDVNPGDPKAEARFKEINEAYQALSNAESRKKYDRFGDQWRQADQFTQPGGPSPFSWFTRARTRGRDTEPRGGFSSIFEEFLGRGPRVEESFGREQVEVPVTITLEEAFAGATRTVQIPADPFSGAPGRKLEVKIPRGARSGARVHISAPASGGPAVELYLKVTVTPHKTFERNADDLLTDVDVALVDAVLGSEVEVPTIEGKRVVLKIPPETQNGRVFRLRGKGMPKSGRSASGHGDELVTVRVLLPTGLSDEERELFERLRESGKR